MRKAILLSFLVFLIGSATFAQTNYDTISVTYTSGDIGTTHLFRYDGDTSSCPGVMNVPVPNGAIVVGVDVEYEMTASSPQRMVDQRSQLWCTSPGGSREAEVTHGSGYSQGTLAYSRTGLDIATGIQPIFGLGVDFELHAGTNNYSAPDSCTTEFNKVDNNTWTVKVIYLPNGSPGFASNPDPEDGAMLISTNPTLTWDFGNNTDTYDLYFGTDNPPTTKVVDNAAASGSSGSYSPTDLDVSTEYFWMVVCKNAVNETPGPVWSFNTNCGTIEYPYFENFDEVTPEALPNCWIALSPSTNPYTKIVTGASNKAHSLPNLVKFKADAEPNPNLVLVLPEVENVSDMVLSMYGKNDVNWNNGQPYTFPFEIGTVSDPFDITTFEVFDSYIPGKNWTLKEVYFSDYTGTDKYIAIRGAVAQYASIYLDDVTLDMIPDCVKPLDLELDDITTDAATISWTDLLGSPGTWQLEYDTTGFELGTGTQVIVNSNPATINGLLDATYYDVYARSICGVGDTSVWSWPITILTECLPKDVPIFEDFGLKPPYPLLPTLPLCWSQIENVATNNGGIFLTSSASYTGNTGIGVVMTPDGDANAQLILVGPELSPEIGTLQVSFYGKRGTTGGDDALIVGTISDPGDYTTFHPYDTITGMTIDWQYYTVYFTEYTGDDAYLAWRYDAEQYPERKVYFDEITIEAMASCIIPINVDITSVSQTSATLYWEDINGATDWEIIVGDNGFYPDPDSATFTYDVNNPSPTGTETYEMTGLVASTLYDAYIRTDCGGDDYSEWNGPVTFRASYDYLTLPATEDFEDGFGITENEAGNTVDWTLDTLLYVSENHSVHNAYTASNENILNVKGSVDLTGKTNALLSFYQIAKTDGTYDHCYVEISTDGGYTYDQLPISTYQGQGNYREEGVYNNPEGPSFDEDSYPDTWGKYNEIPDNTWWKKEYFDLSDYTMYDNVSFRFRLVSNKYTNKSGWYIDNIEIAEIGAPGFTVTPLSIDEDVILGHTADVDMTLGNTGNFPVSYTASVVYDETVLLDENFDDGIPAEWSVVNNGTSDTVWRMNTAYQTYYTFDGTPFAFCNGQKPSGQYDPIVNTDLVSPAVDASAYTNLRLEFDQAFLDYYQPGDTLRVFVYDGTDWVMIYEMFDATDGKLSYNANGVHKVYNVSEYANANFQVKYEYVVASGTKGYYTAIDNVKLRASDDPIGWLTIDGAEAACGLIAPDADNTPTVLTVNLDPTDMAAGTYTAEIGLTSADPANPSVTVPVTMNVFEAYNVNFYCVDVDENPLEGVCVILDNDTLVTGADGVAQFVDNLAGTYDYQASKEHYITVNGSVTVVDQDINDTLVMELEPCTQPWDYTITGRVHTINIPPEANPNVYGEPLVEGDWIGVFYVDDNGDEVCGGAGQIDEDGGTVITAYGNDPTTTEKDGFAVGELFRWRMYVCGTWTEYPAGATYDETQPNKGKFMDWGMSVVTSMQVMVCQYYNLSAGWNGISSYITPFDADVEEMFAPIVDNLTILRNLTQVYWPEQNVNTIGDWDNLSSYVLKVDDDLEFEICGDQYAGNTLDFETGWYFMPTLAQCEASVMDMFADHLDDIVIIQELISTKVFWPAAGIYTLENFVPGRAYKIKVVNPFSVTFPDCADKGATPSLSQVNSINTFWGELQMTPSTEVVAFRPSATTELMKGDVIGVFGQNNQLYGYMEVTGTGMAQSVTLFGDDLTTMAQDGFTEGEAVSYKLYRSQTGETFDLTVEYDNAMENTSGNYYTGSFAAIKGMTMGITGIGNVEGASIEMYPNPASDMVYININGMDNSTVHVDIIDADGRIVMSKEFNGKAELNISALDGGVYFVKINSNTMNEIKKLVIK